MSLVQTTPPDNEPVTLDEAKTQCNVFFSDDDAFLTALIAAARERSEANTWRQFCHATYTLKMRAFPNDDTIELPRPPLVGVTSVSYIDPDGDSQTLSTDVYETDAAATPGRINLKYGQQWPATRDQYNAVTIVYQAGYSADGSDVPSRAKQAILMRVAHWYEFREPTVMATIAKVPDGPEALDRSVRFRKRLNILALGVADL